MKLTFTTENGSEYTCDLINMLWERTTTTDASGKVRAEKGNLRELPRITVGKRAYLNDWQILPEHTGHMVETSVVVEARLADYTTEQLTWYLGELRSML